MCTTNAPQVKCRGQLLQAVPLVVELIKDVNSDVRQVAVNAISQIADVGQLVNSPFMCTSI
jgi:hypothetical protein